MSATSTAQPNDGIELLYTRGCRAWPEALANLTLALKQLDIAEEPKVVVIDTLDQARAYGFYASPTIHVHGIDIDPKARRISRRGLGTGRPYLVGGRSYAVPPLELILTALTELYRGAL